MANDSRRK